MNPVFLELYRKTYCTDKFVSAFCCPDTGMLERFILKGFSKSGNVAIVLNPDSTIVAQQRYGEETFIDGYDDLVNLAWKWYIRYSDRGYPIPAEWKQEFLDRNFIKEVTTTSYEMVT